MPQYDAIDYTDHALRRMARRGMQPEDVELVLRQGEGRPGPQGSWLFELGRWRVAVIESGNTARVLTVIRLKGKR